MCIAYSCNAVASYSLTPLYAVPLCSSVSNQLLLIYVIPVRISLGEVDFPHTNTVERCEHSRIRQGCMLMKLNQ